MSKLKVITPYSAMARGMRFSEWKKKVPARYSAIFNKEYWKIMKHTLKLEGEI
jgi:hypothetical protein